MTARKPLTEMTSEEFEAEVARMHAERYPDGCREPGHSCDACLARLGQTAHKVASRRIGARPGYFGRVEYRCLEPGCKADLS
jgi:hypothetical protein